MRKIITLGIMLIFLGVTISSSGFNLEKQSTVATFDGNTLYVGGSGEGNYSKIQDAINAAWYGDTVFVYDDSSPYYENLEVDKSINLIGEDKDTTIIDAGGSGDVIRLDESATCVTISGFTIQNSGNNLWDDAGIDIHSEGNIISGNIITNNSCHGIYCCNDIEDYYFGWNTISENIVTNNKLGITFDFLYNNEVYKNYVSDNKETGIFVGSSELPCSEMLPSLSWKPLILDEYYNNIYSNTITNNSGYGIDISPAFYTNVFENNITNNKNGIRLAAPYMTACNQNNIYQNNIVHNEKGIAISVEDYASTKDNKIYHNNFIDNSQHAYDEGSNKWFEFDFFKSKGNYWDDWVGLRYKWSRFFPFLHPYRIVGSRFKFDWFPAYEPYDIEV